jgi:hypothetical protein
MIVIFVCYMYALMLFIQYALNFFCDLLVHKCRVFTKEWCCLKN